MVQSNAFICSLCQYNVLIHTWPNIRRARPRRQFPCPCHGETSQTARTRKPGPGSSLYLSALSPGCQRAFFFLSLSAAPQSFPGTSGYSNSLVGLQFLFSRVKKEEGAPQILGPALNHTLERKVSTLSANIYITTSCQEPDLLGQSKGNALCAENGIFALFIIFLTPTCTTYLPLPLGTTLRQ